MRVVLDTNVLISALITRRKAHELLETLTAQDHVLILSEPMIEEFSRVAADEKVKRYVDEEELATFLRMLLARAIYVQLRSRFRVLKSSDDFILRTAKDGRSGFIVTGDKHLLNLKEFRGIRILTVGRMLEILRKRGH